MRKNLLIGSFGAKNIGDELILQAALQKNSHALVMTANKHFSQNFSEKTFQTIAPFPTGFRSLARFLFSLTLWKKKFELKKQVKKIIFPGGGLFKNSLRAVFIWSFTVFWTKIFMPGKKIIFQAQGVDISNNFIAQRLTLWSFNQAESVSVRDEVSKKNLKKIGYKKNIAVVPDAAAEFLARKIPTFKKFPSKKKILVQAAKNFDAEKLRNKISKKFLQHEIKFVVFDELDFEKIVESTAVPTEQILFPTDLHDLIWEFQNAEIFIGQRFHFLVLAHLIGGQKNTFLLEKPYAPKTKKLSEDLGIKEF